MFKNLFLILIFLISYAYANVSMQSPNEFHVGEPLVFTLEAVGSDIEFPEIKSIEGFIVSQNGSSSSLSIINGKKKQKTKKQYKLFPNKSITIPRFRFLIESKEYLTQEKKVSLVKVQKTKSNYIDFLIDVSKKELYVGEQTIFTLTFKYRRDLQIVDLGFTTPNFNNFWSKKINKPKKYMDGEFVVQELQYILFPQKSGEITIPALKVDVSLVDDRNNNMSFFGPQVSIKKVYSNELVLNIKDLPKDVFLVGNFKVIETLDKKVLNAGEALNFDIEISGRGNIDDIPELKLDIPNATIYDNKAVKTYDMLDGKYGGLYKKSFSIVANEDIVIPSIRLSYFDKEQNIVKQLKSKEYKVEVKKNIQKEVQLYKQQTQKNSEKEPKEKEVIKIIETTDNQKLLYFFFGFILSSVVFALFIIYKNINSKNPDEILPLENEIKNAKTVNELLNILLSYINIDTELDKMIYILENKEVADIKQIKKDILKVVKQKAIKN